MTNLTLPGAGEASGGQSSEAALARLPAVDRLLREPALQALAAQHGPLWVKQGVQAALAAARESLRAGGALPPVDALVADASHRIAALAESRLTPVYNLTGTVIHTNLGRALLADEAIAAVAHAMRGYAALEYDVSGGGRGDRDTLVEGLLTELTGAEAATVVNNNAAAVLLSLKALAARREAVISRGELIEIGGAFRMPDIMRAAGCKLVEVGTTNRTHARDYESACGPKTGLIVKAHWSNYAITGFTATVDDAALATIAHAHGVPYMVDLGAGALVDLSAWGLPREPLPQESLAAGADVVTFSGDKLLGGPQAGLIVGSRARIAAIRRHPLKRALRMSKLPLAALEATLRLYLRPERLAADLPTLRLLTRPAAAIRAQAEGLRAAVAAAAGPGYTVEVVDLLGQIGSGSLPIDRLPSAGLAIAPATRKGVGRALDALARALRALPLPVIGRIADDRLLLDLRVLDRPDDERRLREQLPALWGATAATGTTGSDTGSGGVGERPS